MKVFSNLAFRCYVCFPYIDCANPSGKSWAIKVLVAEEQNIVGRILHPGMINDQKEQTLNFELN